MKYASVCSGVEAASLAWEPLGWKPAWFSEIEPFPCAVLKERYPEVPNLGDMTKIKVENLKNGDQKFSGENRRSVFVRGGVDLLVGGTPCQSFSVAGKRQGLDGTSGLAKAFVELLGIMRPKWFVWENVPGCLSSKSKSGIYDFNFLLAAFAERGYSLCWKILDAQYCRVDGYPRAVPQRRRRLFIVGHLGTEWEYPTKVLFDFGNGSQNPPTRIETKKTVADDAGKSVAPIVLNDQGGRIMTVESKGVVGTLRANAHGNNPIVCYDNTVRRITPIECERLMGFPDNWTRIPWRGKPENECPDSLRYKACGNSMCVNVMRWIGMKIEIVERNKR